MSGYAYDYTLAPARPTGWHSVLTNVLTVAAIVAVSAISGAVVAVELLGSPPRDEVAPMVAAVTPPPTPVKAPRIVAAAPAPIVAPPVLDDQGPATVASVPEVPPAPMAVASVPQAAFAAAVDDDAARAAPDSELTFAKGYARRRAAQQVAAKPVPARAAPVQVAKIDTAKIEAQTRFGRAAVVKRKPPRDVTFAQDGLQDNRRTASRTDGFGLFERFDRPDGVRRGQAMAFDSYPPRPARRGNAQQGGGLFDGLF
jgi:hypothetical protein